VNELALFAGAGGGILGGHLLGWRTVCAVEWEPYPASVLCARQNDGFLPTFPVWDDVQTFDGKPWRGIVDVVSGGFPCQDISAAGKGEGIDGERSGMWREMARIIHEVRPRFVFVENSPMLTSRGLGRVLGDLASMGFDAKWGVLGAADVSAPHQRDRIWIAGWRDVFPHAELHRLGWREQQSESPEEKTRKLANTKELFCDGGNDNTRIGMERKKESESRNDSWKKDVADSGNEGLWSCGGGDGFQPNTENRERCNYQGRSGGNVEFAKAGEPQDMEEKVSNTTSIRPSGQGQSEQSVNSAENGNRKTGQSINVRKSSFWAAEPDVGRVADGVAARVDRLKAIGNGQVSEVARRAWEVLSDKR